MSNKIVQLENEAGDNIYPLAGGALTGSISKTMLEEGVFEGPELSEPSSVAYVATDNIQDRAVTSDKIDWATMSQGQLTYTTGMTGSGDYYKIGKFVSISGLVRSTFPPNVDTVITNISAIGAPAQECSVLSRAAGGTIAAITIQPSGNVIVNNRSGSDVSWAMFSLGFVSTY